MPLARAFTSGPMRGWFTETRCVVAACKGTIPWPSQVGSHLHASLCDETFRVSRSLLWTGRRGQGAGAVTSVSASSSPSLPLSLCPESDIADFDGRSSLLYRFSQKLMSTLKDVISLRFKSMQGDGVLFHGEGQRGDHISLELQQGRLALHLSLGRSRPLPRAGCGEHPWQKAAVPNPPSVSGGRHWSPTSGTHFLYPG